MKLVKKNNEEVYQVADNSYFEQYTNTISEPDDNGTVFGFLQENVKGTDIEDDYNAWLKEYANSYYVSVVASKQDDYYAVASDEVHGVMFAVKVENPNEDEGATFEDVESTIHYGDTTAFVYNDGTQTMCNVREITEDSLRSFEKASGKIQICNMKALPSIKQLMRENLLAVFQPAENVQDDGYDKIVEDFNENRGEIAYCESDGVKTYMLIW